MSSYDPAFDPEQTFTEAEVRAALRLVMPAPAADEAAGQMCDPLFAYAGPPDDPPPPADRLPPPGYLCCAVSEGVLDLLSLVSDTTAVRAWRLLGVTPEAGRVRRAALREQIAARRGTAA